MPPDSYQSDGNFLCVNKNFYQKDMLLHCRNILRHSHRKLVIMDTLWILITATIIEGICAIKIARKFKDCTASWKYFIPAYNVFLYGRFSLLPTRYLFAVAFIQAIDIALALTKVLTPFSESLNTLVSVLSFSLWSFMVAKIAVRLGQPFWSYLAATIFSAIASNFLTVALHYIFIPSFSGQTETFPLWAELVAIIIMSLPFISLAFDKNVQLS